MNHLQFHSHPTDAVPVCGMTGQSITLQAEVPNVHEEVIQWAHNNTIIAHWDEEEQQTKCLFLNTEFDKQTLSLTISDLKSNWSGFYAF